MGPPKTTKHPLISYQPIRLIYRLVTFTSILTRLPFWFIRALIPALRQHPKWTFKQSFIASLARRVVERNTAPAITQSLSLQPGKEGDRWAVVDPFESEVYIGPLRSELVSPARIGGTWFPAPPPLGLRPQGADESASSPSPSPSTQWQPEKVALQIHGGGFVIHDGRDETAGYLCTKYVEEAGFDAVFSPQYRLAGHGGRDPFPAALQDVLTSYLYLVRALGVPGRRVTVSGDSAGGTLAAGLLRYIEAFGEALGIPRPGHVVLVSPWVAPLEAIWVDYTRDPLYKTDFLPAVFLQWGARAYALQSDRLEDAGEYIHPLGRPFRTSVPVFVTVGSAEVFVTQGAKWVDEMRAVEGNRVELDFQEAAPHDMFLTGDQFGWDETVTKAVRKVGKFVDEP